jgi:hypothetical protein
MTEADEELANKLLQLEEGGQTNWTGSNGEEKQLICTKREAGEYLLYEEVSGAVLEIEGKISGDGIFASMEEIADYNVKLDKAYTKMMSGVIDFSTASKDAPVDATGLIITPGFQTRTFNETTQVWEDAASIRGSLYAYDGVRNKGKQ